MPRDYSRDLDLYLATVWDILDLLEKSPDLEAMERNKFIQLAKEALSKAMETASAPRSRQLH